MQCGRNLFRLNSNTTCEPHVCPDFVIKRHDTEPVFKVAVNDCNGPLDLTDPNLVLEVNMWAKARLKTAIAPTDTSIALADNIGFNQILPGDVIVFEAVRSPEYVLVVSFDEINKLVEVQRAYSTTASRSWPKGAFLKILRVVNSSAIIETNIADDETESGSVDTHIASTYLSYQWQPDDTCVPGYFYMEFKLLKMQESQGQNDWHSYLKNVDLPEDINKKIKLILLECGELNELGDPQFSPSSNQAIVCRSMIDGLITEIVNREDIPEHVRDHFGHYPGPSTIPSAISGTISGTFEFNCGLGIGVDSVQRFPSDRDGFLIKIVDSLSDV